VKTDSSDEEGEKEEDPDYEPSPEDPSEDDAMLDYEDHMRKFNQKIASYRGDLDCYFMKTKYEEKRSVQ
jgi:hypothetical protein